MAGNAKQTRLSPPLMHAFRAAHAARDAKKPLDIRDEAGERVIAGRRMSVRAAITEPVLRGQVARDVGDLMNTANFESVEDLGQLPEVRRSILNFGLPDLVRRSIDDGNLSGIGREIERALAEYEPRLDPKSIRAEQDKRSSRAGEICLRFLVRADLRCDPVNMPLEFVADMEVDTGKIKIDRL